MQSTRTTPVVSTTREGGTLSLHFNALSRSLRFSASVSCLSSRSDFFPPPQPSRSLPSFLGPCFAILASTTS